MEIVQSNCITIYEGYSIHFLVLVLYISILFYARKHRAKKCNSSPM